MARGRDWGATACAVSVLVCAAASSGCDDVLLYDVLPDGRVLVLADRDGKVATLGDGRVPRHVFALDVKRGRVERWTKRPLPLASVRAWPSPDPSARPRALALRHRDEVVTLVDGAAQLLGKTEQRAWWPQVSPDGHYLALFEGAQPTPATCRIYALPGRGEATSGLRLVRELPRALLGGCWLDSRTFLAARLGEESEGWPAGQSAAQGELVALDLRRAEADRVQYRGPLGLLTLADCRDGQALVTLPVAGGQTWNLALLDPSGTTPGDRVEVRECWPALGPEGQLAFTGIGPQEESLAGVLYVSRQGRPGRATALPQVGRVSAPRWIDADQLVWIGSNGRLGVCDVRGTVRHFDRLLASGWGAAATRSE